MLRSVRLLALKDFGTSLVRSSQSEIWSPELVDWEEVTVMAIDPTSNFAKESLGGCGCGEYVRSVDSCGCFWEGLGKGLKKDKICLELWLKLGPTLAFLVRDYFE